MVVSSRQLGSFREWFRVRTTCAPHHSLLSIPTLSFTNAQLFDSRFH